MYVIGWVWPGRDRHERKMLGRGGGGRGRGGRVDGAGIGGKLLKVVFPFVVALLGFVLEALNMGSIGI